MNNLNKKQKIILIIIIILCIFIYIYTKKDKEIKEETNLAIEQTTNEKNEEEKKEKTSIFVHISGAVNKEGVVELEENSRISDAIEKAGGIKEEANITNINLAYKLEDGMKIHIPTNKEVEENKNNENKETKKEENKKYVTNSSELNNKENEKNNTKKQEKININTATKEELDTLPGIGPSTALKIIEYREEKWKFKNADELKEVSGIGEAKYLKIKDLITTWQKYICSVKC